MDIDFNKLAAMPKFEGHNSRSLHSLYQSMQDMVIKQGGDDGGAGGGVLEDQQKDRQDSKAG